MIVEYDNLKYVELKIRDKGGKGQNWECVGCKVRAAPPAPGKCPRRPPDA